jgi:hypothetical protein
MTFPSVSEAIRLNDLALARAEIVDLASRFDAATAKLEAARAALTR